MIAVERLRAIFTRRQETAAQKMNVRLAEVTIDQLHEAGFPEDIVSTYKFEARDLATEQDFTLEIRKDDPDSQGRPAVLIRFRKVMDVNGHLPKTALSVNRLVNLLLERKLAVKHSFHEESGQEAVAKITISPTQKTPAFLATSKDIASFVKDLRDADFMQVAPGEVWCMGVFAHEVQKHIPPNVRAYYFQI